ncbi:DUF4349 domain-containing protein [Microbacterium sp. ZW T5_45]|uniref:DUF4349 domain-containing protein n=1 Tax=Microbacterium sp. ZW T5_45 TaxID=3378080 RepID=UPI00385307AB
MTENTPTPALPELSDAVITRIESAVFAQVEDEPRRQTVAPARARSRRRRWLTGLGVAAAFVAGVLVTPPLLLAAGGSDSSTAGGEIPGTALYDAGSADRSVPGDVTTESESLSASAPDQASTAADESVREIVASAYATLEVDDVAEAVAAITELATDKGGYVEGTEIGKSGAVYDTSIPTPVDSGYGWISVRVPSAELPAVVEALGDAGEVLSSSTSKQDVTATAIDLRARVDAARASVQRLTELMAQSGSVSELIEAEVALTTRQAELESYEQQLASIEDQVAMSTLQVQLTLPVEQASADPAGFGDGLLAGWNGLIVSLNALVIAIGFVLPWLGVAAVIVLVIWLVRRARRTRRVTASSGADDDA